MTRIRGVADDIKRALDDMPVHVRQLAHMFRRHGQKQSRNRGDVDGIDRSMVPGPLRGGWRENTWHTPDSVVGTGKGDRPSNTGEYLNDYYVRQHLSRFTEGATRFYRADSLGAYGPGQADHTTFVFPRSEVDGIIDSAGGDPRRLGEMLGLGDDFFVDSSGNPVDVVRADFDLDEITQGDIRIPTGNEAGANDNWIPGGYLPQGTPEAVISVPADATGTNNGGVNPVAWPGTYEHFHFDGD